MISVLKDVFQGVQWWLTSDQIFFRRFLNHQSMFRALGLALGINISGALGLYLPIDLLLKRVGIEKVRNYLKSKVPRIERYFEKINGVANNGLMSSEKVKDSVVELVDKYEYEYLWLIGLSVIPIPFLGTAMTAGAILAEETLEIKYGILVILLAKAAKVFAMAAIAYFAYYL